MATFKKPVTTIEQQIEGLQKRGLIIHDLEEAAYTLSMIGYFRLLNYLRPFRNAQEGSYRYIGTEFDAVIELYAFDRELRLLIMDAIERVEVAVRSTIADHMGNRYQINTELHYGSHWYLDGTHFSKNYDHAFLLDTIKKRQKKAYVEIQKRAKKSDHQGYENYAGFYQITFDCPTLMPSWAMVEDLTFGELSHLYKGLAKDVDRKIIAKRFDVPQDVFQSWLHSLNFVRNCCAHHSRLWNRELGVPPKVPKAKEWALPAKLEPSQIQPSRRIYVVLLMLAHLMRRISPYSQWHNKVKALIVLHPDVPLAPMGFVANWQSHTFWGGDK